jgi:hypothetical protein
MRCDGGLPGANVDAMAPGNERLEESGREGMKALYEFEENRQQEIIKRHLSMPRGGEVTAPVEGAYGSIYSITLPHAPPGTRIAAKCPRIKRFGRPDQGLRNRHSSTLHMA